jgi:MFS transporter, FHS family, glucose/mannose:H+ symporter
MGYNRKMLFRAACAGMLLFGVCMITLGSVAPDLQTKLNLDALASGALFSILPAGIIIGSMIFGPVADRYGYRLLLAVSSFCLCTGFEGLAFSSSADYLKIFILLIGIGGGAINGATNALVSDISETGKGADISLLGVFYGLGALGMPLLLGILKNTISFETIVAGTGVLSLLTGVWYLLIKYPLPKQAGGVPLAKSIRLAGDKILLLIALFLGFQSGFEGIINNWTTTYLAKHLSVGQSSALYGLSSFVAGMAVMRMILGSILRKTATARLLIISFVMIVSGLLILKLSPLLIVSFSGLVLLGAGLSGGFPIMLGFVGRLYAELSGTAFSLIFFIALAGNTFINLLMGLVAQKYGIDHLITFALAESVIMILLATIIVNKTKQIQ